MNVQEEITIQAPRIKVWQLISSLSLVEEGNQTQLSMGFDTVSSSLGTKIISSIMGLFFTKAMQDAIKQDLIDIKSAAEG
jgi:hypothetical protein